MKKSVPKNRELTVADLVMEYFSKHPKEDLEHGPVVDYVEKRYRRLYNRPPRDTWRQIRRLHQEGKLIKVKKGIYRYDLKQVRRRKLYEFSPKVREAIFRRDGYKCVVCGRGEEDGVEIHADHKIPMDKAGRNTVDNGQTLCSEHNILKRRYSQVEFGKKLILRLHSEASKANDKRMKRFCREILNVYDKYGIDKHLESPDK